MKVEIKTTDTVGTLIDLWKEKVLRVNHEYQRGLKWNELQKLMFIDSIFRKYSIPAFYFHEIQSTAGKVKNTFYDIVDGQQRIDAIYSYSEGAFPLLDPSNDSDFRFPNFVKNRSCPWAGKRFDELEENLKNQLKDTTVVVYEISNTDENEIRDLFIRLQGGTPLTPQDKRDSWPGHFTEFVLKAGGKSGVDKWFGFPVFKEIAKAQNESRRRQLVAQIFMLFWSTRKERKFCDIKSVNIDQFYHEHVGFDQSSNEVMRFDKICKKIHQALIGQPKVVGHYLIHLFMLTDLLLDDYRPTWETNLGEALFEFDRRCRQASKDAKDNNPEAEFEKYWQSYAQWARTNSDNASTIQRRHAFFSTEMSKLLNLKKLDSQRSFTEFERTSVFYRDQGQCQYCKMNDEDHKVAWSECDIHHVIPYAEGGATNINNAALMHKECHPKAKKDVKKFQNYWDKPADLKGFVKQRSRNNTNYELPPDGTKLKFEHHGRTDMGDIKGRVIFLNGNYNEPYKTFSAASQAVTNTSRNGWNDWRLRLPGEHMWILASDWKNDRKSQE